MLLQGWDDNYRPTRKQKGGKNSSYYTMVRIQGFVSIWVWGESEKEWCECVRVHVFSAVRIGNLWCFDVLKIWFYSTINVVFAIGESARREKIYKVRKLEQWPLNEASSTAVRRQEPLFVQTPHVSVNTRVGDDGMYFTLSVELKPNFRQDRLKIVQFLELLSFLQYVTPLDSASDDNWEEVNEGRKPLFLKWFDFLLFSMTDWIEYVLNRNFQVNDNFATSSIGHLRIMKGRKSGFIFSPINILVNPFPCIHQKSN